MAERRYQKKPSSISGLLDGAMKRHGIGKQVHASLVVKYANEVLDRIIDPQFRHDMAVLSFQFNTLTIACRHSASMHLAQSVRTDLQDGLTRLVPDVHLKKIFFRIDPREIDQKILRQ